MNVTGTGKVICNYAKSDATSSFSVQSSATLALKSGADIGTGAISVSSNATLQVTQSGTNTVNSLTLADNAILGFNFTQSKVSPVLDVTTSVTLPENGTVKVKVSAANGSRPLGTSYVISSGGKFTGANLALDAGSANWIKDISVNADGNIVLDVKSSGMHIHIR